MSGITVTLLALSIVLAMAWVFPVMLLDRAYQAYLDDEEEE